MARHRVKVAEWEWDGEHFIWPAASAMTLAQLSEVAAASKETVREEENAALEKLRAITPDDILDFRTRGMI